MRVLKVFFALVMLLVDCVDLPMGLMPDASARGSSEDATNSDGLSRVGVGKATGKGGMNDIVHTVRSPVHITFTSLQHAVFERREKEVRLLLERGADPNHPNNLGCTPLYIAAHTGSLSIMKALVAHGGSVSKPCDDGTTPVYNAAKVGNDDTVRYLQTLGADISQPTHKDGVVPLHGAAQNGHITTVRLLVDLGKAA
jgi:hypothetical protein